MRLLSALLVLSLLACGTPRRGNDDEDPLDAGDRNDAGADADAGSDAGPPPDACTPNPCTEFFRTRCRVSGTAAICSCDEGYRDGAGGCEPIPGNPCAPNPCTGTNRNVCSVVGDEAVCACNAGFVEEGGACVPPQPNPCAPNPCTQVNRNVCTAEGANAVCSCNAGYELQGSACVASSIDPCDPNPCTAANRGVCVANGSVAECRCNAGFEFDDGACVDAICRANPCTQPNRNVCVSDGIAARFCFCNEGYELQGGACVLPGSNPCEPNPCTSADKRTCSVSGGVAVCSCTAGWTSVNGMCVAPTCSGGALPAALQASESAASNPTAQVAVVWTGSNHAVIWSEARGTPAEEIWASKIRSDGTKDGADVRLTNAPGLSWLEHHGVVPTSNGFAIAWVDARYTANRRDVVFARFDANLQRIGDEKRITTDLVVEDVALAVTNAGYVVAWANGTLAGTPGLHFQRLDPQGTPIGTPVQGSSEEVSDIALASDGTVTGVSFLTSSGAHATWVLRADLTRAGSTAPRASPAVMTDLVWNGTRFMAVSLDQSETVDNHVRITVFDTAGAVSVDSSSILSNPHYVYWSSAAWSNGRLAVLADLYATAPSSARSTVTRLHRFNAGGVELDSPSTLVQSEFSNAFAVGGNPNGFTTAWRDQVGSDVTVLFRRWCE